MKFNFLIGKALSLIVLLLLTLPVTGYLYGFQEFRSRVNIELVSSQSTRKRSTCYNFNSFKAKLKKIVPIFKWVHFLIYFDTKIASIQKDQDRLFENIPKIKIYSSKRCFDFDEDHLLNNAVPMYQHYSTILFNQHQNEKFVL